MKVGDEPGDLTRLYLADRPIAERRENPAEVDLVRLGGPGRDVDAASAPLLGDRAERDDDLLRLEEPPLPVESVKAGSSSDEEFAAALRRITELSDVKPTKRRSLRSLVVSRLRRRGAPSDF